jgi:prepilin-type N-terminal cleavage/methylation domain-containing protein
MKRLPFRLQSCRGFTLVETMIVVAIIGIVTAVAIPNYLDWNRKYKLKDAVGLVHANMGMARLNAINQNVAATVTVTQAAATDPVTVAFSGISGLATLTLDSEVSLSNAAGATVGSGVNSPQSIQFNSMGMRVNPSPATTASNNASCISNSGAPTSCTGSTFFAQAFNFKNSIGNNYRIVVSSTGKVSWCYTNTCAQ